ncbi:predicted protein [Naegleria gruberi]|uniref:Predicted protein n=1 Tax=Naegleria gruberi TaxID=5762 RepID=D2VIJ7_NAEGR|nr:uncharacterized protein NAEGRDRAFT_68703 [Naegleria gruberi]EFC43369.1 predicted protein [Naegleria gruberi]|eukprot:XP_002676113.1 predicted protein [Naegleria gruberi strain NEG-M]
MMKEQQPVEAFSSKNSSSGVCRIFSLVVGDPMKEGKGLGAKTTYLIQTEVVKSGFPETRIVYNSRKRYSDFKLLHDECRKLTSSDFKTIFPPKSFKKFNEKLIAERKEAFQHLLLEFVDNPVLLNNQNLKLFLSIPAQTHLVPPSKHKDIPSSVKFKFSSVLKNEEMKYTFKQFLIEEHNIEPFEFLESCFQIQKQGSILIEEFDRLVIQEFVEHGSSREINIDNRTRNLKNTLSTQTDLVMWNGQLESVLQPATNAVKLHLKTDSFPRFVYNWPTFKQFLSSKSDAFIASITKGSPDSQQALIFV